MRTKKNSKVLALLLALAMVFVMSVPAFADTSNDNVTVSITTNNFNTSGEYVGGGNPLTTISTPITNATYTVESLNAKCADYSIKETFYLPAGTADPLPGQTSVLDAILIVLLENGYDDVRAGWSSYSNPTEGYFPGGYINDFGGTNTSNNVTYFNKNGEKWARSTGMGWNIAYKPANGSFTTTAPDGFTHYMTDIPISGGMEIIMDLSPYSIEWDTGELW